MIAIKEKSAESDRSSDMHARFIEMLPQIRRQARVAFRGLPSEQRDDLIAETLANAFCAFVRLVERGRESLAYPTPLARYAVQQVRSGRRVGSKMNVKDITSPYAQLSNQINVERLDRRETKTGTWQEIVVEDRHAGPADIAATRIDFNAWLAKLPERLKQMALHLATGETTQKAARRFNVSPGRISQIRRELLQSWEAFNARGALADLG